MVAKLVAEEGPLKGLVLSFEGDEEWIIGRDPDESQLVLEEPSVSRKHLRCQRTSEGFLLENLSDTNPALINDQELTEPYLMQNGDMIKIGNGLYRFYSEETAVIDTLDDDELPEQEEDFEDFESEPEPEAEELEELEESEVTPEEEEVPLPQEEEALDEPLDEAPDEVLEEDEEPEFDTIFEEEIGEASGDLAEIDFDIEETGRWLLKVVGGPNTGAEFYMQAGHSYVIGTDPTSCDIVFHDTSVSRQHARVIVTDDETVAIEDLNSRNGTLVDGNTVTDRQTVEPNTMLTTGTTSFVVFDREGEMQTIISPLLPSIVKVLQKEEKAGDTFEALTQEEVATHEEPAETETVEKKPSRPPVGAYIAMGIIIGLFAIVGMGTFTLFRGEPIEVKENVNTDKVLTETLAPFPSVRHSFNKKVGKLLLVGHVLTVNDKNQLLYSLQGLDFIKSIDDSGIVIDQLVWKEMNQVLHRNPTWKGVNVQSVSPGRFVLTGYLTTRAQSENLSDYVTANFPYLELLENRVVVEQDIIAGIETQLHNNGVGDVIVRMNNGEVVLTGEIPGTKDKEYKTLLQEFRQIPGVRNLKNYVTELGPKETMVNLSDKYTVTGLSRVGKQVHVVIKGKILAPGDILDGMTVQRIEDDAVFLERGGVTYRIDF